MATFDPTRPPTIPMVRFPLMGLPYPNVTPFTHRDGITYTDQLEQLKTFVGRDLVPSIDTLVEALIKDVNKANSDAEAVVNGVIGEMNTAVETAEASADYSEAEAVRATGQADRAVTEADRAAGRATAASTSAGNSATSATASATSAAEAKAEVAYIRSAFNNLALSAKNEFGLIGDGVTDDTAAVRRALASGKPIYWGGAGTVIRVREQIQHTLTGDANWHGDGAVFKADPVAGPPLRRVFSIDCAGFNVNINGQLTVDANMRAHTAWYFANASTVNRPDFYATQLRARNVYRSDVSIIGGDGIFIVGNWGNVYLDRPDVRNVIMAAGAGVQASQGVCGITIGRLNDSAGLSPLQVTVVSPYIANVYSEDAAYFFDQDGMRIFGEYTSDVTPTELSLTRFEVSNPTFVNCRGRAFKAQTDWGRIDHPVIIRNRDVPNMAFRGTMPELDWQTGGGIIRDIELQYTRASAPRIVNWTGTRQVGGRYSHGLLVSGVKMSITGGTTALVENFLTMTMAEQGSMTLNVEDVEMVQLNNTLETNFIVINGTTDNKAYVRVRNVSVPLKLAVAAANGTPVGHVVYRNGLAMPLWVDVTNATNTASNGTFIAKAVGVTSAASVNVTTGGMLVQVTP